MGLLSGLKKIVGKVAGPALSVAGVATGNPALVAAGASITGAQISSKAAGKAADAQQAAADQAAAVQKYIFDQQNALNEPFRQMSIAGGNRYLNLLGLVAPNDSPFTNDLASPDWGKYARDPTLADLQMDPGYGFRFDQGMKALNNQAAARGGLISGNALRAATQYGQDMGSQEYQNAFNRYQVNRSNQLNPLESLIGIGQTANNALMNAGTNYASNTGNILLDRGNARASGYVGQANALNSALSNIGGNLMDQYTLNRLLNSPSVAGGAYLPSVYPMTGTGTWNLPTY